MKEMHAMYQEYTADLKYEEMRRHEPRSRVGNAVPVGKSKPLNRKKAKAARKARKKC